MTDPEQAPETPEQSEAEQAPRPDDQPTAGATPHERTAATEAEENAADDTGAGTAS